MKILVIRFSSFGDILAMLSVPAALRARFPDAEIHWVTRADFAEVAECSKDVKKVWSFHRKKDSLVKLITQLRAENYTHIYDAHNNLRSHLICWALRGPLGLLKIFSGQKFLRRSQYRWRRFLLFKFHINKYPKPFVHQWALIEPLAKWGVSLELPKTPLLQIPDVAASLAKEKIKDLKRPIIALSPSASYELKRWPLKHWQKFVSENPQFSFVALGGPEDHFIKELAPDRCLNLAGHLSYLESAAVIAQADLLVANDTGLMHVAEQLGKACIALLGPAPFGYPGRQSTFILQRDLSCRPCSKHGQGPCTNKEYQKCMVDIQPTEVRQGVQNLLGL